MSIACLEISVENRVKRLRLSKAQLIRWVKKMLGLLGFRQVALALVLVENREIRRLHKRFLGKDRATDVLAFGPKRGKFFPQREVPFLGDVVVSVEMAKRQSPRFGNRWDEELLLYVCHGILHLMGYRDSTPQKKGQMEKKEERVLKKLLGRKWRSRRPKPLF